MDFILTWTLYHYTFLSTIHKVDLGKPVLAVLRTVSDGDTLRTDFQYGPDGKEFSWTQENGSRYHNRIITDAGDRIQAVEIRQEREGTLPGGDRVRFGLLYRNGRNGSELDSVLITRNDTLVSTEAYTLDSLGRTARVRIRDRTPGQTEGRESERILTRDPLGAWMNLEITPGAGHRYEYDGSGRVLVMKTRTGDTGDFQVRRTFAYDAEGRWAKSEVYSEGVPMATYGYEYAPLSQVLGVGTRRKNLVRPGFPPAFPSFLAGHDLLGRLPGGRDRSGKLSFPIQSGRNHGHQYHPRIHPGR